VKDDIKHDGTNNCYINVNLNGGIYYINYVCMSEAHVKVEEGKRVYDHIKLPDVDAGIEIPITLQQFEEEKGGSEHGIEREEKKQRTDEEAPKINHVDMNGRNDVFSTVSLPLQHPIAEPDVKEDLEDEKSWKEQNTIGRLSEILREYGDNTSIVTKRNDKSYYSVCRKPTEPCLANRATGHKFAIMRIIDRQNKTPEFYEIEQVGSRGRLKKLPKRNTKDHFKVFLYCQHELCVASCKSKLFLDYLDPFATDENKKTKVIEAMKAKNSVVVTSSSSKGYVCDTNDGNRWHEEEVDKCENTVFNIYNKHCLETTGDQPNWSQEVHLRHNTWKLVSTDLRNQKFADLLFSGSKPNIFALADEHGDYLVVDLSMGQYLLDENNKLKQFEPHPRGGPYPKGLRVPEPEDRIFCRSNAIWTPLWNRTPVEEYFKRICHNAYQTEVVEARDARLRYKQQALGYEMYGGHDDGSLQICIGKSQTGKSSEYKPQLEMMGDYGLLAQEKGWFCTSGTLPTVGTHSSWVEQAKGTLVVFVDEIPERNACLNNTMTNACATGELLNPRAANDKNSIRMRTPKQRVMANDMPVTNVNSEQSKAVKNRARTQCYWSNFQFAHDIPARADGLVHQDPDMNADDNGLLHGGVFKRDAAVVNKFIKEHARTNYFMWALEGALQAAKNKWVIPELPEMKARREELWKTANVAKRFVADECTITNNQDDVILKDIAYEKFQVWCQEHNVPPVEKQNFYALMHTAGVPDCKDRRRASAMYDRHVFNGIVFNVKPSLPATPTGSQQ
jgi:hypothetical protein